MGMKAYFMIGIDEKFCPNGYQDILRDLESIPDVKSVDRVKGACDLLVKVDTNLSRMMFVANKIMASKWAKRLNVLQVEPIQPEEYKGLSIEELMWLKKVIPAES